MEGLTLASTMGERRAPELQAAEHLEGRLEGRLEGHRDAGRTPEPAATTLGFNQRAIGLIQRTMMKTTMIWTWTRPPAVQDQPPAWVKSRHHQSDHVRNPTTAPNHRSRSSFSEANGRGEASFLRPLQPPRLNQHRTLSALRVELEHATFDIHRWCRFTSIHSHLVFILISGSPGGLCDMAHCQIRQHLGKMERAILLLALHTRAFTAFGYLLYPLD
jgi:hypothetical protein